MRFARRTLVISILFACAFAFPKASFAQMEVTVSQGYANIMSQGIIFANICSAPAPENGEGDSCQCRAQGICSLAEITQVAVNIIILILGISGTIALLMFVYGGANWVIAQGRPEYIDIGKNTMKNAIIGLAIIFGAYALVNFVISVIGGVAPGATIEDTIESLDAKKDGTSIKIDAGSVIETN